MLFILLLLSLAVISFISLSAAITFFLINKNKLDDMSTKIENLSSKDIQLLNNIDNLSKDLNTEKIKNEQQDDVFQIQQKKFDYYIVKDFVTVLPTTNLEEGDKYILDSGSNNYSIVIYHKGNWVLKKIEKEIVVFDLQTDNELIYNLNNWVNVTNTNVFNSEFIEGINNIENTQISEIPNWTDLKFSQILNNNSANYTLNNNNEIIINSPGTFKITAELGFYIDVSESTNIQSVSCKIVQKAQSSASFTDISGSYSSVTVRPNGFAMVSISKILTVNESTIYKLQAVTPDNSSVVRNSMENTRFRVERML